MWTVSNPRRCSIHFTPMFNTGVLTFCLIQVQSHSGRPDRRTQPAHWIPHSWTTETGQCPAGPAHTHPELPSVLLGPERGGEKGRPGWVPDWSRGGGEEDLGQRQWILSSSHGGRSQRGPRARGEHSPHPGFSQCRPDHSPKPYQHMPLALRKQMPGRRQGGPLRFHMPYICFLFPFHSTLYPPLHPANLQ